MNVLLLILTLINLLWLSYITYITYKRYYLNNKISSKPNEISKQYKINLVRYNPFEELGGDQSFILCLLDNTNSGVIITSLHNRESTRIYAKSIKNGNGENMALSKEETKALIKTINS